MVDLTSRPSASETHGEEIARTCTFLRVVLLTFSLGQLLIMCGLYFLKDWLRRPTGGAIISLLGLLLFPVVQDVGWKVWRSRRGVDRANGDIGLLIRVFSGKTLVIATLLEVAAVISLVAYYFERNILDIVLLAMTSAFIIWLIPSEMRLASWVDDILEEKRRADEARF